MSIKLSTCNGDFKLSLTFDNDGKSFYDVYSDNNYEKFVGEYRPIYDYNTHTLYNHPTGRTFYGIYENHKNIERMNKRIERIEEVLSKMKELMPK